MKRMIWWVPILTLLLLGGARPAGGHGVPRFYPLSPSDDHPAALQQNCLQASCAYLPFVGDQPPVTILNAYYFTPKYPPILVAGLIKNHGNETVYDVNITAELYLGSSLVETITGTTSLPATFPGGTNPFVLSTNSIYDNYTLSAWITSWTADQQPESLPLTVVSKNASGSMDILTESGEIRNDQPVTLENIQVVVDGALSWYAAAHPGKNVLAPGEMTTYQVTLFYPSNLPGGDFTVWALGQVRP
jgi:hypothetical protein